ncbi:MAG: WYL domain-containing protein [Sphaerochaetaceae bacterium]|nr:WYL domain-containing protein [Sphaerochaetaceae bacterium]
MSQTERIIYIDKQLSKKKYLTINKISEKFEISTRQAKRDLEYMRDRFYAPIIYDHKEHYYKYEKDFSLTNNNDDNTLIFKAIFDNFSHANGLQPLSSSLISEGIDNTLSESDKNLSKKILFLSPIVDLPDKNIFSVVSFSMKNNYCIKFKYTNLSNIISQREVEPLRLVNDGKAWYLIAYDIQKKGLRNFHLSRMENPQELKKEYSYIEDAEELKKYITSGFGIFMNTISYNATIEFFGKAVNMVKTQIWHKEQKVIIKNNTLFLSLPFSSYDEILSKILSFGALAKPMAPDKLVDMWKAEINKMQKIL